ncbi:MAG: hypothetical protein GY870_16520 [archaeon]|nr:hypothetical protein [archaeon]
MKWHNAYGPDETRCTGYKTYCINNNFHNLHGPAAIHSDGDIEYYLDNICHTKEEWENRRHDY